MKKQLLALAVLALAAGTASAQANDTLAKIKSSGTVNLGVRDSSGLAFTVGGGKYVGFHTEMAERTVDVWIGRLRRALRNAGAGNPLRTVRSLGYVFDQQ